MDRPQNKNLQRGGSKGRKKGTKNAKTKAAEEIAGAIVNGAEYLEGLDARVKAGKAPHMELLLWHYRFGKPKERVEISGSLEVHEYREQFQRLMSDDKMREAAREIAEMMSEEEPPKTPNTLH